MLPWSIASLSSLAAGADTLATVLYQILEGEKHTQSLIRIGSSRINWVGYRCVVTLDGDVALARTTFVVVVGRVSSGDVAANHVVLLLVLVVG